MKTIIRLSKLLFEKYPNSAEKLTAVFDKHNIEYEVLENTKDIWTRDYMPLCLDNGSLVSYVYEPDYLQDKKYEEIKTKIPYEHIHLDLVIDGGNFVRHRNKAIMTDKIFSENPTKSKKEIINTIKSTCKLDDLIIIPKQPYDTFGHIDSMIRWVNEDSVIINDFSIESASYNEKLTKALRQHNLKKYTMKYSDSFFSKNRDWGAYLNFLKIKDLLIVPIYGIPEDKLAINQLKNIYTNCTIETIELNEIMNEGGAIHCITSERVILNQYLIVEVTLKQFKILSVRSENNLPTILDCRFIDLENRLELKTFLDKLDFNKHYSVISFDKNFYDYEVQNLLKELKKQNFEFNEIVDDIFAISLPNKEIKNGFLNLSEKQNTVLNSLVWHLVEKE